MMKEFELPKNNNKRYYCEFKLSEKKYLINMFFSMKCFEVLFDSYEEKVDYRIAFIELVKYMYLRGHEERDNYDLFNKDILCAKDMELLPIMDKLLEDDESLQNIYVLVEANDVYEKFYVAHQQRLANDMKPIVETLKQVSIVKAPVIEVMEEIAKRHDAIIKNLTLPSMDAISNSMKIFSQKFELINKRLIDAQQLSAIIPKFDFPEMSSLIAGIGDVTLKADKIFEPLIKQIEQINISIGTNIQEALSSAMKPLMNLDLSFLTYHREWSEKHDFLVKHGWFYLNELPDRILEQIHNRKNEITSTEIDEVIVGYYRENQCSALKEIVKSWKGLEYFDLRKRIFHEALVNHSRRYFNSSTTLLAIHTEGVITDFVRIALNEPRFKAVRAIKDIQDGLGELPLSQMSLADYEIYNSVFESILEAFVEQFDLANPNKTSNNSRHKIAHGHVVDRETEARSLKMFLYLNEVFRLFKSVEGDEVVD